MKTAKIIPISEDKAVAVDERGKEVLVEVREVDSPFFNKAPVKGRLSLKGVINLLSRSGEDLDEVEALINAIDSFLSHRFLETYLEEDEEAKEELRKVFRLLDIARDKIDTIQRDVSLSSLSLIDLN